MDSHTWGAIGVIVAIIGLALTVLIHLFKNAEFWGKLLEKFDNLEETVKNIESDMSDFRENYYSKEDSIKDFAWRDALYDKEHKAIWAKIDALSGKNT